MTALPPLLPAQRTTDQSHLKLLAVFHFVGSGLGVVGLGFIALHYVLMRSVFNNPDVWLQSDQPPPPPGIFAFLQWFYLLGVVWCVASAVLNLVSGFSLLKRKRRTFSLVVAGINCVHMPLGTVLGVFTIIVLLRDSVRVLYEGAHPTAGSPQ